MHSILRKLGTLIRYPLPRCLNKKASTSESAVRSSVYIIIVQHGIPTVRGSRIKKIERPCYRHLILFNQV